MTIFYHQSGKRGEADFVKTLTTPTGELRLFTTLALQEHYGHVVTSECQNTLAQKTFQIWGVPSGARRVISKMDVGDIVLLIGQLSRHSLEDGRFYYAGRVLYVLPREDFDLSSRLWGDGGFPLIFFMQGKTVDYSWSDFATDFDFKPNYFLAGQTMQVSAARLLKSRYSDVESFASRLRLG